MATVTWKNAPDDHDYPAAQAYLTLLMKPADVALLVARLPDVPLTTQKAKDILRGNFATGVALQIADGYHRVCASYHVDENTDIPCRIADLD